MIRWTGQLKRLSEISDTDWKKKLNLKQFEYLRQGNIAILNQIALDFHDDRRICALDRKGKVALS